MLKTSSLFGKLLQFTAVTLPFVSSKFPQRRVLRAEVMPVSVNFFSKIAAFMLLISILRGCMEDQRFGAFLAPSLSGAAGETASGTAAPASTSQDRQFLVGIYPPI